MTALPHSPIERCVNAEEYRKLRVMILAAVHRRKFARGCSSEGSLRLERLCPENAK